MGCENLNADALSRRSLSSTELTIENYRIFNQFKYFSSSQPRSNLSNVKFQRSGILFTQRLKILCSEVGQKKIPSEVLRPYHLRKEKHTIKDNILHWKLRVVVHETFRLTMLYFLYDTHIKVVRIKGLARSRVWWQGIDADKKRLCSKCVTCSQNSRDPAKSCLSVWDFSSGPCQRLHINYARPFYRSIWLIWIDAYFKYGGAEQVLNANEVNTVRKLQKSFAMLGDRKQIVSDNGTWFLWCKFDEFCNKHKIRNIQSAPNYPATNGEAERVGQVFQRAICANFLSTSYSTFSTSDSKFDTEFEIYRFLQRYRTIQNSPTGRSHSEHLFVEQYKRHSILCYFKYRVVFGS